jgi:hypothetical protein
MGQNIKTLAHQQEQLHQNQHQMMEQMTALSFNQSNTGCGIGCQGRGWPPPTAPFAPNGFGRNTYGGRGGQDYGDRGGQGRGRGWGRGRGPPAFIAGCAPPIMPIRAGRAPEYTGPPPAAGGGYYAAPPQTQQAPLYSNLMKQFANWNACYSCGFDVVDGHTSQMCPQHLRKPDHDCYFTRQNAQQYINVGYACSTNNHHKTILPRM